MSVTCNTCGTPVSSTCVTYQGDKLYFTDKLTDKGLNGVILKLSQETKALLDILNKPIDKKCLTAGSEVKTVVDFIQILIDAVCQLKQAVPIESSEVNLIDISGTGLTSGCDGHLLTIEQAILLALAEISSMKAFLNNPDSNLYIPNV